MDTDGQHITYTISANCIHIGLCPTEARVLIGLYHSPGQLALLFQRRFLKFPFYESMTANVHCQPIRTQAYGWLGLRIENINIIIATY